MDHELTVNGNPLHPSNRVLRIVDADVIVQDCRTQSDQTSSCRAAIRGLTYR